MVDLERVVNHHRDHLGGRQLKNSRAALRATSGRDCFILAQALYWFIREQQKLPEEQFEWSNAEDAKLLLETHFHHYSGIFVDVDKRAGRTPADLTLEKWADDSNVIHLA
jgi:hypothetical protein